MMTLFLSDFVSFVLSRVSLAIRTFIPLHRETLVRVLGFLFSTTMKERNYTIRVTVLSSHNHTTVH